MLKKRKKGTLWRVLLSLTLTVLILCAIGVAGAGIWAATLNTALDEDVFLNAAADKTTRLYAYGENGELSELSQDRISGHENALYSSLEEISPYLRDAFVAIEDKRFYTHKGVDWARTLAAAGEYVVGGRSDFGGSTITQQLVKNLTGESEKSVRRKISELIRAARLEKSLSKNQILEQYLNVVNLSQNCYGVRTAANAYFSKEPLDLTLNEAACIAAITNNPSKYDPIRHPESNLQRRNVILAEMYRQGMIDRESYLNAVESKTELNVDRTVMSGRVNSWYADMVVSDVIDALIREKGMTRAAASRLVYCGGLKIYTAANVELQEMLSEFYEDAGNFPTHQGNRKAQSAMIIVDPKNGDILAVSGAVGKKDSNRIQNFATDAKRPSGSVIKPLSVYAPALRQGLITWGTVFDDVPLSFRANGAPWPRNAPNIYRGLTTVASAVTDSVNTVSVSVLERLGSKNSLRFLRNELGIASLDEKNDTGAAALALGQQSEGVTLRELVGGYTALADRGVFHGTRSFYRVLDSKDQVILENGGESRRVLDAESAAITTMMLRKVVQNGTARSLALKKSVDIAGKTGTSGNNCDKWFIGYTPELLAGVWYGHEYPESLADVKGNPALTVFDEVIQRALEIRPESKKHLDTSGDIVAVRYCRDSGKLPCEACGQDPRGERIEIGFFKKGTEPTETCDRHVSVRYCSLGGVATSECPDACCHTVSLLRVMRSFPRQIKVLDAPYTFGGVIGEEGKKSRYDEPYYAVRFDEKQFFGIGMGVVPYNHACQVHGEDPFWSRRTLF